MKKNLRIQDEKKRDTAFVYMKRKVSYKKMKLTFIWFSGLG